MGEIHARLNNLASGYAAGRVSLGDFRAEFGLLYFLSRQAPEDKQANALASSIAGPLAEFGRGHRDEASLRQVVARAIPALEREAQTIRDAGMWARFQPPLKACGFPMQGNPLPIKIPAGMVLPTVPTRWHSVLV